MCYDLKSQRAKDWMEFSDMVLDHLEDYTVPQYGDKGEDTITGYSIEQCLGHVEKYVKRYGRNQRDGQQLLDFLKMAHYVQCAAEKYINLPIELDDSVIVQTFTKHSQESDIERHFSEVIDDIRDRYKNFNVKVTVEVVKDGEP